MSQVLERHIGIAETGSAAAAVASGTRAAATAWGDRLPCGFTVLVAGHMIKRLERCDQAHLRRVLASVLKDVVHGADLALGALYETSCLRLITGASDGTDEWTLDLVFSDVGNADPSLRRFQVSVLCPWSLDEHTTPSERKALDRIKEAPPGAGHSFLSLGAPRLRPAQAGRTGTAPLTEHWVAARETTALAHADLVVAVWDGGPPHGHLGGTVRLVQRAALARKPVVWIDTSGTVRVLRHDTLTEDRLLLLQTLDADANRLKEAFPDLLSADGKREFIAGTITSVLRPDGINGHPACPSEAAEMLANYVRAKNRSFPGARFCGYVHTALTTAVCGGMPSAADPPVSCQADCAMPRLKLMEYWNEMHAGPLSKLSRDANWLIYLFAACAVFCAVFGAWLEANPATVLNGSDAQPKIDYALTLGVPVLEFFFLLVIFLSAWNSKALHQRWLLHRLVAEHLRGQRMLSPLLGVHPAALRSVWRWSNDRLVLADPASWLFQRALSATGLAQPACGDPSRPNLDAWIKQGATAVECVLVEQTAYHKGVVARMGSLAKGLSSFNLVLFGVTMVVVGVHLFTLKQRVDELPPSLHLLSLIFTIVFPALGASLTGVLEHLEAVRVEHQSRTMCEALRSYRTAVQTLCEADDATQIELWRRLMELRRLAEGAAQLMAGEIEAWHDLLADRHPQPA